MKFFPDLPTFNVEMAIGIAIVVALAVGIFMLDIDLAPYHEYGGESAEHPTIFAD